MAINLGATAISDVKLGSTQVNKVYLGTTEVWSKGGSGPTDWGVLSYRSGISVEYVAQDAMECTVNSINATTLEAFLAQQEDPSEIMFRYEESMGGWQFGLGGGDTIPTEDMLATTGINVTLDEGAQYAEFRIEKSTIIDPSSPVASVALTQAEYNSLGSAESYTIHGVDIPREAIEGFSFGTQATTTPFSFLGYSSISSIDFSHADSLTSIGGVFLNGCSSFNQAITLPDTVTSIGYNFMNTCSSFNQPIILPSNLTTIGGNFLGDCWNYNQPITLPNSVTSIEYGFLRSCNKYTSAINLGSLQPSVATSTGNYDSYFSTPFPNTDSYNIGITIVGAYASDWKATFPDRTAAPYRKLLIG